MFSFGILFGVIITTAYVALIYKSTALMLLAYLEAAFFAVSFFYLFFLRFVIRSRVEIPVGISEVGKENLVKIIIKNRFFLPILRMKAYVEVKETLSGKCYKRWMTLSEVTSGDNPYIQSLILPGAGNYRVSLTKLRIYDLTGLLYLTKKGKSSGKIQILPKLHDVPVRLTAAIKNFHGEADVYDEHRSGHDNSELFQVRSYQKGDRMQRVHWKLTAKQDELMVKEQSLPKSCPVVLFLNCHPAKKNRSINKAVAFVEAVASLSFSLTDARCPHYVVWYDHQEMDIMRVRVDDEESLFYFLSILMNVEWRVPREELLERYKEKYKMEPYVWAISLDENLILRKNDEMLAQFSEKELKESLSQIELIL